MPSILLYDSTLRDGAQARGVDFSLHDKRTIALALDGLGIDVIEGGFAGANPSDDAFFAAPPALKRAKLTAFGMTRRAGRSSSNDPALAALLQAGTKAVCMVGKASAFHIEHALGVAPKENHAMIADSVAALAKAGREVFFDAEHFFDGFKASPEVALDALKAAHDAGAAWLVLCDTNGGSMPEHIAEAVRAVAKALPKAKLGIHCHNDMGLAVANSLAAVEAGATQIQGTINGIGERCGNANLVSLIPTLILKMGYACGVTEEKLTELTHVSRLIDDLLNRAPNPHAPYVGSAAFAHKGGLHGSAVAKDSRLYEHIMPERVGNRREILVSDKAGKANLIARLHGMGIDLPSTDPRLERLLHRIKEREAEGYSYESAEGSLLLLARETLDPLPEFYELQSFRALIERRFNAKGELVSMAEATVKLRVKGKEEMAVAEGNGPVNAIDAALRKALVPHYPALAAMRLVDYKVRILTPQEATRAVTRVLIESTDGAGNHWTTVGVSSNIIDASYNALADSLRLMLLRN